jgi:hypothetical protein
LCVQEPDNPAFSLREGWGGEKEEALWAWQVSLRVSADVFQTIKNDDGIDFHGALQCVRLCEKVWGVDYEMPLRT